VILKSQKGSATILFALSLPVFICVLAMSWDIGMLYTAKITARHCVTLATRAAAAEIELELEDLTSPENLEPVINKPAAYETFKNSLDKNIKHHKSSLFSINENDSIEQYISGFIVTNNLGSPVYYQVGSRTVQISQPSVAAEIEVPVELSAFGALVMDSKDNAVKIKAFAVAAPEIREEIDS
jgi:hypothetical protein